MEIGICLGLEGIAGGPIHQPTFDPHSLKCFLFILFMLVFIQQQLKHFAMLSAPRTMAHLRHTMLPSMGREFKFSLGMHAVAFKSEYFCLNHINEVLLIINIFRAFWKVLPVHRARQIRSLP